MKSQIEEIYRQYKLIEKKLVDDESRKIFDFRIDFYLNRSGELFEKNIYDESKNYTCNILDEKLHGNQKDIFIFGVGYCGKKTKRKLDICKKYNVKAFCDNDKRKVGMFIENIPVIDVKEIQKEKNSIIIIASNKYSEEMYSQICNLGIDKENIIVPVLGYLEIQCGWQYFDVFSSQKNEIFVDAGSYDGETIIDFYKWIDKNEGVVYGMEPIKEMYEKCCFNLKKANIKDVLMYNSAAWEKNEELLFDIDMNIEGKIMGGSRLSDSRGIKVKGESIDNMIEENGSGVTYIKMDIEGSELPALKGAAKSIVKYRPKLGISVYYKPNDILELSNYILQLMPDYKLYLRHYTGGTDETVLYAI